MMLHIVPTHWYSWNVTVTDASRPVADIATSWWPEKGALTIDGATYRVPEAPIIPTAPERRWTRRGPQTPVAQQERPEAGTGNPVPTV